MAEESGSAPNPAARAIATLLVNCNGHVREISVEAECITLGRDDPYEEGAQHVQLIEDDTVSRRHARLVVRADWACAVDLDSTNGTRVNGVPLTPAIEVVIHDGDEIALGEHTHIVCRAPMPAQGLGAAPA